MKTYNNLFNKIASIENIKASIKEAAKGKRHKKSVQFALEHAEEIALKISKQLQTMEWRPKEIHNVRVINDGIAMKKRNIVCPEFIREQIVHHAIMRVTAPLFQKKFYRYSCGSVPKRGKEFAVKYLAKQLLDRRKAKYFTVADVHHCFESIRPSIVFKELRRTISDKKVLLLFAHILRHNKVRMPDGTIKKNGLLMGMFTSPWFANILLNPLDHLLKEECEMNTVVRYMDDIIIIHGNKRKMKKALEGVEAFLDEHKLKLKQAPAIHLVDKVAINYIGATLVRGKTTLGSRMFLKAKRAATKISKKDKPTLYDARKMVSYAGQFKHYDTRKAFAKHIEQKVNIKECRGIISEKERAKNVMDKSRIQ